jgi:hypothetical protein
MENLIIRNNRLSYDLNIFRVAFLFILLIFILPLYFIYLYRIKVYISINTFIAFINFSLISLMIVDSILKRKHGLANIVFWVFNYIWMGLIPLLTILNNEFPYQYIPQNYNIIKSMYIIILGNFAYYLGYNQRIKRSFSFYKSKSRYNRNAYWIFSLLLLIISILFFSKNPYFYIFPIKNDQTPFLDQTLETILNVLAKIPPFIISSFNIFIWKNKIIEKYLFKKNKIHIIAFKIYAIVILVYSLILNNPISTTRYQFGIIILTYFFTLNDFSKMKYRINIIALLTIGIIFLFSIFSYRFIIPLITKQATIANALLSLRDNKVFLNGDFDAFTMINIANEYVDKNNIMYGRQLLLPLFFYIPRSIWLNKPVGSGWLVSSWYGLSFNNVSCPLWAEAYINFGFLGVIIFLYILGRISKVVDEKMSNRNIDMISNLLSYYYIFNLFILLRGDLNTGTNILLIIILILKIYDVFNTIRI